MINKVRHYFTSDFIPEVKLGDDTIARSFPLFFLIPAIGLLEGEDTIARSFVLFVVKAVTSQEGFAFPIKSRTFPNSDRDSAEKISEKVQAGWLVLARLLTKTSEGQTVISSKPFAKPLETNNTVPQQLMQKSRRNGEGATSKEPYRGKIT